MDNTITYDEVATLVGVNIPTLEPRPNFERIHALRRHLERCLQHLPCPQSIQHGWKGMVMARPLYSLLTNIPFRLPTNQALFSFDAEHRTRVLHGPRLEHKRAGDNGGQNGVHCLRRWPITYK